jgi:hypothetical protein
LSWCKVKLALRVVLRPTAGTYHAIERFHKFSRHIRNHAHHAVKAITS